MKNAGVTTIPKRIIWLDNEPGYNVPFVLMLKDKGYVVDEATTLTRADYLLKTRRYDLLLLDVMIPAMSEEEEERYSPEETDHGHKAGLAFYRTNRELLDENSTHVLVLTVRIDSSIRDEFVKYGLPPTCFATKITLRDPQDFLERIKNLI